MAAARMNTHAAIKRECWSQRQRPTLSPDRQAKIPKTGIRQTRAMVTLLAKFIRAVRKIRQRQGRSVTRKLKTVRPQFLPSEEEATRRLYARRPAVPCLENQDYPFSSMISVVS